MLNFLSEKNNSLIKRNSPFPLSEFFFKPLEAMLEVILTGHFPPFLQKMAVSPQGFLAKTATVRKCGRGLTKALGLTER